MIRFCVFVTEDDSPGDWSEGDKKVFYLFARADRYVFFFS
jgi:hypothetical protein